MVRNGVPTTSLFLLLSFVAKRQCFAFRTSCISQCRHHHRRQYCSTSTALNTQNNDDENCLPPAAGQLEKLKQEEAKLASQLASIRRRKLAVLRSRPLNIGVLGFGRFGQFIGKSFTKYGNVVGISRSDYSDEAEEIGVKYMPLDDLESFVVEENLDVIVLATSIVSFEDTVKDLVPHLLKRIELKGRNSCPLIVDVASVKEHPRNILLERLPEECDVLCTHPMFGPDSAKLGWQGQTFVYEKTRVNKVVLENDGGAGNVGGGSGSGSGSELDSNGNNINVEAGETPPIYFDGKQGCSIADDDCEAFVEGMDRIERFLSIWEEEGCNMTPLSCEDHDAYAANSQFITHLMGRILGAQGLAETPIDTKGFQSVLKLIENTNADSFDLFYGLYKYNKNSGFTIGRLRGALDDVVGDLLQRDGVVGVFNNSGNRRNEPAP